MMIMYPNSLTDAFEGKKKKRFFATSFQMITTAH